MRRRSTTGLQDPIGANRVNWWIDLADALGYVNGGSRTCEPPGRAGPDKNLTITTRDSPPLGISADTSRYLDLGLPMSDVLVTFVVPAYNEEALIGECLAAITAEVSRTSCLAEIIVVNNGSSDDTRRIALATPGVKVIDEPQKGLVQARRAGCLAAEGEYIANIDADTILAEGWLQRALAEFATSPELIALSGPYIYYDLPMWARLVAAGFFRGIYAVHLLSRVAAGAGSVMQGGNFIVSRRALERAGGFNPDFRFWGEDAELARRLARVGKVKFTFALQAFSSGRRLVAEGLFRVLLRYSANYLWTHLFKRPFSTDWYDVRHVAGMTTTIGSAATIARLDLRPVKAERDLRPGSEPW